MKTTYFSVAREPGDDYTNAIRMLGATPMGIGTDGATYGACPDAQFDHIVTVFQNAECVVACFDQPEEPYGVCI